MTQAPRQPASAHAVLRERTAAAHAAVDATFGAFRLTDAASYRSLLLAHAQTLPPLEAVLRAAPGLPAWRSRSALLAADLDALGSAMPEAVTAGPAWSEAELHGLLYVLEGSRLGGRMLARQVADGLPSAFLSAGHEKGEWRALLGAIEAKAAAAGDTWLAEAVEGALRGFAFYRAAAGRFAGQASP